MSFAGTGRLRGGLRRRGGRRGGPPPIAKTGPVFLEVLTIILILLTSCTVTKNEIFASDVNRYRIFIARQTIIYKLIILISGRICKYLNSFTLCMQVQCQCKEISVSYIDPILFISVRNKILVSVGFTQGFLFYKLLSLQL